MPQIIKLILFWLAVSPLLSAADYRFVKIDFPKSVSTDARGINARGDIVGSYEDADGISHGFLLRKRAFTSIDVPKAAATLGARGINARGDIVGNFLDANFAQHGYLLRDGKFTQIDYPGASATFVFGINNAGDLTGSRSDASGSERGFIFKDGVFYSVRVPGSLTTQAHSAQDSGRVLVGHATMQPDGGVYGFVRNKSSRFRLIAFPGLIVPCTAARWINQRGEIVGIFAHVDNVGDCGENPSHGFVLQDSRYKRIDFPRSISTRALAINDDGVIVGNFIDKEDSTHGFQAMPTD
jgi:uncharacterized membrane protein